MRKIQWETQHLTIGDNNKFKYESEDENEYNDYDKDQFDINQLADNAEKLISTPIGIFMLNDDLNPYKNLKFYIGHTNFNITAKVFDEIEKTDGVEIFHVISRYRFTIAIGKMFNVHSVRQAIEDKLCKTPLEILNRTKNPENKEYIKWYLYILPNGEKDFQGITKDSTKEEVEEYEKNYRLAKEASNKVQGGEFTDESTEY